MHHTHNLPARSRYRYKDTVPFFLNFFFRRCPEQQAASISRRKAVSRVNSAWVGHTRNSDGDPSLGGGLGAGGGGGVVLVIPPRCLPARAAVGCAGNRGLPASSPPKKHGGMVGTRCRPRAANPTLVPRPRQLFGEGDPQIHVPGARPIRQGKPAGGGSSLLSSPSIHPGLVTLLFAIPSIHPSLVPVLPVSCPCTKKNNNCNASLGA